MSSLLKVVLFSDSDPLQVGGGLPSGNIALNWDRNAGSLFRVENVV